MTITDIVNRNYAEHCSFYEVYFVHIRTGIISTLVVRRKSLQWQKLLMSPIYFNTFSVVKIEEGSLLTLPCLIPNPGLKQ